MKISSIFLIFLIFFNFTFTNKLQAKISKGAHLFWGVFSTAGSIAFVAVAIDHYSKMSDCIDTGSYYRQRGYSEEAAYWDKKADEESKKGAYCLFGAIGCGLFAVYNFNKVLKEDSNKALFEFNENNKFVLNFPQTQFSYINNSFKVKLLYIEFN